MATVEDVPHRGSHPHPHPYRGRTAVLATRHGKLPLVGPPLTSAVGLEVVEAAVDTDALGTFTGEVPRALPPLETAVAKARLGMAATGCALGLASEGSIGPDQQLPVLLADTEIVVLVDAAEDVVLWDSAHSFDIVAGSTSTAPGGDLTGFLARVDFPSHHLIVRAEGGSPEPVVKGIGDRESLERAIAACAGASPVGRAEVQSDLRAHCCPSRRPTIVRAAERLAARLRARCPRCAAPGWGVTGQVLGLPCARCCREVPEVRAETHGCVRCGHEMTVPTGAGVADPSICPTCNP